MLYFHIAQTPSTQQTSPDRGAEALWLDAEHRHRCAAKRDFGGGDEEVLKLKRILERALLALISVLLVGMVCLMLWQVFTRYVLARPPCSPKRPCDSR